MAFGMTPTVDFYQLLNSHGQPPASAPAPVRADIATDLSPPMLERQRAVHVEPPPGLPHTNTRVRPERFPGLPPISGAFASASERTGRLPGGGGAVPFGGNNEGEGDDDVDVDGPPSPQLCRQAAGEPYVDPKDYTPNMRECADILRVFASPQTAAPSSARTFALRGVIRAIKKEMARTFPRGPPGRTEEFRRCVVALEEVPTYFAIDHVVSRMTFLEVAKIITNYD
jgi:hypothetical protein